jgi:hypothetical protein
VRNRFTPLISLKQLEDVLWEEWYTIPLGTVQNLYDSIPRITAAVLKEKDGPAPYFSIWYRCCATIARKNMCCLVAVGKHVSDIPTISRQPPIATREELLEAVFSVGSAHRLYSEDPRLAERVQLQDICQTVTTWARKAEVSPLLDAVASERLEKA